MPFRNPFRCIPEGVLEVTGVVLVWLGGNVDRMPDIVPLRPGK